MPALPRPLPLPPATPPGGLPPGHLRRLRSLWRSAGWPCHDPVEAELLAGGWLVRAVDAMGRETLRLTDAGVQALAAATQRRRAALSTHEALAARVARTMQRDGRIVWRGLTLRAPLPGDAAPGPDAGAPPTRWVLAQPDVFSVRHTTREDALAPAAHEVKVRRADLLADLRRPDKARAYAALAGECWYVLAAGIGGPEEVPPEYGVLVDDGGVLAVARPAPRRALRLPFPTWMALARAAPEPPPDDDAQPLLAPASDEGDGDPKPDPGRNTGTDRA